MSNIFKTSVLGVGPWCVEFSDGEIVHCRTEERAKLIAAATELLSAAQAAWNCIGELSPTQARAEVGQMLCAAIAKATE
jgi:hypothetical protein